MPLKFRFEGCVLVFSVHVQGGNRRKEAFWLFGSFWGFAGLEGEQKGMVKRANRWESAFLRDWSDAETKSTGLKPAATAKGFFLFLGATLESTRSGLISIRRWVGRARTRWVGCSSNRSIWREQPWRSLECWQHLWQSNTKAVPSLIWRICALVW